MAVVSNTLIGKSRGSVGNTTFSTWKGINVLKSKAVTVANPQSDTQMAQRSAFTQLVSIYRNNVAVLSLGFKEMAVKKSAFNAFTSENLKNAFDLSSPPTATLIPADFLASKGTISNTPIDTITADESDGTIIVDYDNTAVLPGQSATDNPVLMVYNATKDEWTSGVGTEVRTDGDITLTMPAGWVNTNVIHCYLGFISADGQKASDSQYLQGAIVA